MSETENEPEPKKAKEESQEAPTKEPLSRRDFLRRAGSEAVKTGAAIVPGAAVARVVLGAGKTGDEETDEHLRKLPGWLRGLAKWRASKQEEKNG